MSFYQTFLSAILTKKFLSNIEKFTYLKGYFHMNKLLKLRSNGLVIKALDSQSIGPMFKTTLWLQGRLSLSSFRGR